MKSLLPSTLLMIMHWSFIQHADLEILYFCCSHIIKKLLSSDASCTTKAIATPADKISKLPKLDVSRFDGDIRSRSAKTTIEGLLLYDEVVDCLKGWYNKPHLLHCAYVCTITDTFSLEGLQWERFMGPP